MAAELVSIVVNNFNYARFLREAIDSALAQTYPHKEIVVVDDCSTDGSQDVIRSYGDRIVPVLQPVNGGQGAAMNAGFAASRGDVIIFLDADDYLYPSAAAEVAARARPDVAIIQYRLHLVDVAGKVIDVYPPREVRFDRGDVSAKVLATGRYEGNATTGMAFSRAALAAIMPMPAPDFRICADGYLMTLAPLHGAVESIEEPLGAYRRHQANFKLSMPGSAAGSLHRDLHHDALKLRILEAHAASLGRRASPDAFLRDYQHVGVRIGSLLLDPAQHPVAGDSQLGLGFHGIAAALRAPVAWPWRTAMVGWFLSMGVLPRALARSVFLWRFEPGTRPAWVVRSLKLLRRTTR